VGEQQLAKVTAMAPDSAGRAEVGKRLASAERAAGILSAGGDYEALAALADDEGTGASLQAAVVLGDLERAGQVARHETTGKPGFSVTLRRGGWLCLLGDRPAGLALLRAADRQYVEATSSLSGEGWVGARLGALACAERPEAAGFPPRLVPSFAIHAAERLLLLDPKFKPGRRNAWAERILGEHTAAVIAGRALLLPQAGGDLGRTLAIAEGLALDLGDLTSAYSLLRPRSANEGAISPDWLEQAARAAEQAAATAPAKLEIEVREYEGPSAEAAADPAGALRRAAWKLWLESAVVCAREGWTERARAAIGHAEAVARPDLAWLSAAAHLATGNAAGAERALGGLLASGLAEAPVLDRSIALLNHAWALAALGRDEQALAAAKDAHRAALSFDREADTRTRAMLGRLGASGLMVGSKASVRSGWLLAALMLRTGKIEPIEGLPAAPGELPESSLDSPHATIAAWLRLASLPDAERARARNKAAPVLLFDEARDALPAVVYVVGEAARGADVEVWLDRMFARWALDANEAMPLRLLLWARAEAARWRGDDAAAKRWRERAGRLFALIRDPKQALLAQVVGL
jgi:hypothetical protein